MLSNCNCHPSKNFNKAGSTPVLSTFLLIILPKCPFCVLAYSSVITICVGPNMYLMFNNWGFYIHHFLALFIILMLFLSWRGQRTILALIFPMIGFTILSLTHKLILLSDFYNLGADLLLMGIWLNGSFIPINKIKKTHNPDILS